MSTVWPVRALGAAALVACVATAAPHPVPQAPNEALVIEHVTVVPMDGPRLLEGRTVVITEGRIDRVEPASGARIPPAARRIDGRGRFLMPALADLHVHVRYQADLLLYIANGVTVVRNMDGGPQHLEWRARIRAGTLLGPQLYTAGPTIGRDPADADALVREQKQAGYDFLKLYHFMSADGYRAVLAAARRHDMRSVGHRPPRITTADAMRMGLETVEHLLGLAIEVEKQPSALRRALVRGEYSFRYTYAGVEIDERLIPGVVEDVRRAAGWICPTLIALDRWMPHKEATALLSRPYMKLVPAEHMNRWRSWNAPLYTSDWTPEAHAQGKHVRRLLVRRLHHGGVKLLLGTDAGAQYTAPGFSIHEELEALVDAGLTPFEALRTGTSAAAAYLGLDSQWGIVRPGARADLLLLDRNPLERIQHAQRPAAVIVRGRWLERAALDARLAQRRPE